MGRSTAAIAGVVGLSFGSGAFTNTTASRDFDLTIANENDSQLAVEPSGVGTDLDSVQQGDNEIISIDSSGISPQASVAFGDFNDISNTGAPDHGDLEFEDGGEILSITNQNETGEDLEITVEIDDWDIDGEITLLLETDEATPSRDVATDGEGASVTLGSVEDGDAVLFGFILVTDGTETIDESLTIEAELDGS